MPEPYEMAPEEETRLENLERLIPFFSEVLQLVFRAEDPDLQELAKDFGIVEEVPFDPAIHRDDPYPVGIPVEPGDPWLVPTPDTIKALGL